MYRHAALAGLVALAILSLCAGCARTPSTRSAAATRPEKVAAPARRKPRPTPTPTPTPTATPIPTLSPMATLRPGAKSVTAGAQQALTAAVAPLVGDDDDGQVAVAVDDLSTGADAAYSGTQEFVTASIVKVDILSTLLYQAQQSGQALSSQEQELASTMIENSDDDAASDLYDDAGQADGIDDANQAFGLSETTVGTGGYWGLTNTTVDDQIRLLRLVYTRPSVLTTQSQDYIADLMSQVEADQQWGVPAAADDGTQFWVKNGWLPSGTTGRWEINSIGEITHDGQHMLIAVLSEGSSTEGSGISLVQTIAEAAADAMAKG